MRAFIFIFLSVLSYFSYAHDYKVRGLHIDHPWMITTASGVTDAYVFMIIENRKPESDQLFFAESSIVERVEVRTLLKEENMFGSKEQQAIEIPAQSKIAIGLNNTDIYYIKLIGINRPIFPKFQFELKLHFKIAGVVPVAVYVEKPGYFGFLENSLGQNFQP